MAHPLYARACRLVGRPVLAHHVNGMSYRGILHSVANHGIYMTLTGPGTRLMSGTGEQDARLTMLPPGQESNQVDLVYAPGAYFAFGALTGLTLGALASPYWW